MRQVVVGMDIGGTYIRIGIVSMSGELLSSKIHSNQLIKTDTSPVTALEKTIRDYMSALPQYQAAALCIGLPSLLRVDGKATISTPNLPALDHVDIVTPLEKAFACPVYLTKDANLLLLCIMAQEGISKESSALGLFYGTGIGNAIWLRGGLLTGHDGVAGELGHIPVKGNPTPCACGQVGCMETIASGRYLVELCAKTFPDTPLKNVFRRHWPNPRLREFVENLALPAATEINIINPDVVFIGGGIVYMDAFPQETLLQNIVRMTRKPYPAETLDIRFTQCRQEAGVIGGGLYALARLPNDQRREDGP